MTPSRASASLFLAAITVAMLCGCATTRLDPALFEQKTFAVASVHARVAIDFSNVGVAPMLYDNELGLEALEMELGETEARLGELFGVEMVPVGKALMAKKAYDQLPEATPPEDWTQLNDMIAVDIEAPAAVAALANLARVLGVDAVVVLRHEWAMARDRFEVGEGVTAIDRCSLLVVDEQGRRLWDDVVLARAPVQQLFAGAFSVGFNGGTWADEARTHARRTSKQALDALARRYTEGKAQAARPPS